MYWVIQWDSDGCPPSCDGAVMKGTKDQAIAVLAKNHPKPGRAEDVCIYEVDILENKGCEIWDLLGEGTYCCNHLETHVLKEVSHNGDGLVSYGVTGWHGYMLFEGEIPKEILACMGGERSYVTFRTKTKLEFVWDSDRMDKLWMEKQKQIIDRGGNVSELLQKSKWWLDEK